LTTNEITLDARVLAFAALVTLVTSIMAGVLPALRGSRQDPNGSLTDGRSATATLRQERLRRGNVFAQAWLFRIARTVAEFARDATSAAAIDAYVQEHYGETPAWVRPPEDLGNHDYEIIVSGLKAAEQVQLIRPVGAEAEPDTLVAQWA